MTGRTRSQEELAAMMADPAFIAVLGRDLRAISEAQRDTSVPQGLDAATALDAMAYLSAAIIEAHPDANTNKDLRLRVEDQGTAIHQISRGFRRRHEDTGTPMLEKLGVVGARGAAND